MVEKHTNVEAIGKENRGGKTIQFPNNKENQKNMLAIENKLSICVHLYLCISICQDAHTDKSLAVYIFVIHRDKSNPHTLYRLCTYVNSPWVSVCVCVSAYICIYLCIEKERGNGLLHQASSHQFT